jgi:heptosyltransferase III
MVKRLEGNEKVLFVVARGFGDAIIADGMINLIGECFQDLELQVVIKQQYSSIFSGNPHIKKVYYSPFPIGMKRITDFGIKELVYLIRTIKLLRKEKFDLCVETMGDVREALIARFVKASRSLSVIWHPSHMIYGDMRGKLIVRFLAREFVEFSPHIQNVYDARNFILQSLGCQVNSDSSLRNCSENYWNKPYRMTVAPIIGVHPFAFRESRMWPFHYWRMLINKLRSDGFEVWVFSSEIERRTAEQQFNRTVGGGAISLKGGDLQNFLTDLHKVSMLVGLDSFSVHAAHVAGKPSIAICHGERYKFWLPPSCRPVLVDHFTEEGTEKEGIWGEREVSKVYEAVHEMLGTL